MLSKEGRSSKKFTNSNGRTIYGECESPCSNKTIELDDIYEDEPSLRENFHKNYNILAKILYKVLTTFDLILISKPSWYLQISFNHEKNALLTHLVIVPC